MRIERHRTARCMRVRRREPRRSSTGRTRAVVLQHVGLHLAERVALGVHARRLRVVREHRRHVLLGALRGVLADDRGDARARRHDEVLGLCLRRVRHVDLTTLGERRRLLALVQRERAEHRVVLVAVRQLHDLGRRRADLRRRRVLGRAQVVRVVDEVRDRLVRLLGLRITPGLDLLTLRARGHANRGLGLAGRLDSDALDLVDVEPARVGEVQAGLADLEPRDQLLRQHVRLARLLVDDVAIAAAVHRATDEERALAVLERHGDRGLGLVELVVLLRVRRRRPEVA